MENSIIELLKEEEKIKAEERQKERLEQEKLRKEYYNKLDKRVKKMTPLEFFINYNSLTAPPP